MSASDTAARGHSVVAVVVVPEEGAGEPVAAAMAAATGAVRLRPAAMADTGGATEATTCSSIVMAVQNAHRSGCPGDAQRPRDSRKACRAGTGTLHAAAAACTERDAAGATMRAGAASAREADAASRAIAAAAGCAGERPAAAAAATAAASAAAAAAECMGSDPTLSRRWCSGRCEGVPNDSAVRVSRSAAGGMRVPAPAATDGRCDSDGSKARMGAAKSSPEPPLPVPVATKLEVLCDSDRLLVTLLPALLVGESADNRLAKVALAGGAPPVLLLPWRLPEESTRSVESAGAAFGVAVAWPQLPSLPSGLLALATPLSGAPPLEAPPHEAPAFRPRSTGR